MTAGTSFELRVEAEGTAPLSYQWRKDGVLLAGATSSSWGVAAAGLGDSGNYDVVVGNSVGSVASAVAEVAVVLSGLVWVGPGSFRMGSVAGEPGRGLDEGPVTVVRLSRGIWLGEHEVTQQEFEGVMGYNPGSVKGDNLPVDRVSWQEATNYCGRLTLR